MTTRSIWTFESGRGVVGVERVDAKEELLPNHGHPCVPTHSHTRQSLHTDTFSLSLFLIDRNLRLFPHPREGG